VVISATLPFSPISDTILYDKGISPDMSIIRIHKQKNFSIISNTALNDSRLTFKAKGLWAYLLSKPDDWNVHVNQLVKAGPDGKTAIYSALKELKAYGYVEYRQVREGGHISGYEYVINEDPIVNGHAENLNAGNLNAGNLNAGNRDALLKTDRIPSTDLNKNDYVPAPPDIPSPADPPTAPAPPLSPSHPLNGKKAAQPPTIATETSTPGDIKTAIAALVLLIPNDMRKPSTVARVAKAVESGLAMDLIKSCIEYSNDHSDQKTWIRYKSHLGQCIDGQWGEGYSREDAGADDAAREKTFLESRRTMPDSILKMDATKGCKASAQILQERG
jgi:hypothetical protein